MQTQNPFIDDLAKMMAGAANAAQGATQEAKAIFRSQAQRFIQEMDLVGRDEFEAMKAVAETARSETEALKAKIASLEAMLATLTQSVQSHKD